MLNEKGVQTEEVASKEVGTQLEEYDYLFIQYHSNKMKNDLINMRNNNHNKISVLRPNSDFNMIMFNNNIG